MKMVMIHNGDKRCPYCMSMKLKVDDYDVAPEQYRHKGKFWFRLKCRKCGGFCNDITNLETKSERRARLSQKEAIQNEVTSLPQSN